MTKEMMVIIALFVFVLFRSFVIEPNSLDVARYEIEDNSLQGIKVAFLSDFHLKRRDWKRLDKIVRMTNSLSPDAVLLGGDFAVGGNINKTMNPTLMANKLSLIDAPKVAVLGNSDWSSNGEMIKDALKNAGIYVLENANKRLVLDNRYVDIVGLADYESREVKIAQALRRTGAQPRIVITHNPDVYFDIVDDVSLILAGHTHGGQFVIPGTKPIFVASKYGSEFASGLIKKTKNKMIVSKGLGVVGIPVRLNCKPEIVFVDFVRVGTAKPLKKAKKRL